MQSDFSQFDPNATDRIADWRDRNGDGCDETHFMGSMTEEDLQAWADRQADEDLAQAIDAMRLEGGPAAPVGAEVSTWQEAYPWMLSIGLHLLFIVVGFFAVWTYQAIRHEQTIVVPLSAFINDQESQPLAQHQEAAVPPPNPAPIRVDVPQVMHVDPRQSLEAQSTIRGEMFGGGQALPLGSSGAGDSLSVGLYGVTAKARTIVYVVDASGSLVDRMDHVIAELKASIAKLNAGEQQFTIIFFQGDEAIEVPPAGMKPAADEVIRAVGRWISPESGHIVPQKFPDPEPALQLALQYQPDVIYFLSDGFKGSGMYDREPDRLLRTIRQYKKDHATRINTIQFADNESLEILKKIADENGGVFRTVSVSGTAGSK